jgi:hypothetical protein
MTSALDGGEWLASSPEWNANGTWCSQAVTHPSTIRINELLNSRVNTEQNEVYEGVSKSFRTKSITKYTLACGITRWEVTQRVMAAKLTRLSHKTAIQLHFLAESCTICSSRSRWPVRKLLDTPSYTDYGSSGIAHWNRATWFPHWGEWWHIGMRQRTLMRKLTPAATASWEWTTGQGCDPIVGHQVLWHWVVIPHCLI